MDAHDFLIGHSLQAQGVGLPQVALVGKGQAFKILLGLDTGDVHILEFLPVKGAALLEGGQLCHDAVPLLLLHHHALPPAAAPWRSALPLIS